MLNRSSHATKWPNPGGPLQSNNGGKFNLSIYSSWFTYRLFSRSRVWISLFLSIVQNTRIIVYGLYSHSNLWIANWSWCHFVMGVSYFKWLMSRWSSYRYLVPLHPPLWPIVSDSETISRFFPLTWRWRRCLWRCANSTAGGTLLSSSRKRIFLSRCE